MCVDRRVPCRARQALAGSVRDVHASLRVHIPLAETKVNQVDLKTGIGGSYEASSKQRVNHADLALSCENLLAVQ
jgi:hypothetical protein